MPRSGKKASIGRELASARRSLPALEQSLARLAAQVVIGGDGHFPSAFTFLPNSQVSSQ